MGKSTNKVKINEIVNPKIVCVSLVRKGANGIPILLSKASEEEPQISTTAVILKADDEKHIITSVVYEPNKVDSQGDFMTADTIEKMAIDYMENYQNVDIQHSYKPNENLKVVESYIAKADFTIGETTVKKGSWVMSTKVNDETVWGEIKKGNIDGYSIGGMGTRVPQNVDKAEEAEEQEKGLVQLLKEFKDLIFKAEGVEKPSTKKYLFSFKSKKVNEQIRESIWPLRDGIGEILNDATVLNKVEVVTSFIDSWKEYVLGEINSVGIQKAASQFMDKNNNNTEEEEEMDAEKMQEVLSKSLEAALAPIKAEIEELKKEGNAAEGEGKETQNLSEEEILQKAIEGAVNKAIDPLKEEIVKMKKIRQAPLGAAAQQINKEDEKESLGIQI